ncbi:MAG: hypothetical protein R3E97_16745 [Candidatus Eisenbacteria bacterium]
MTAEWRSEMVGWLRATLENRRVELESLSRLLAQLEAADVEESSDAPSVEEPSAPAVPADAPESRDAEAPSVPLATPDTKPAAPTSAASDAESGARPIATTPDVASEPSPVRVADSKATSGKRNGHPVSVPHAKLQEQSTDELLLVLGSGSQSVGFPWDRIDRVALTSDAPIPVGAASHYSLATLLGVEAGGEEGFAILFAHDGGTAVITCERIGELLPVSAVGPEVERVLWPAELAWAAPPGWQPIDATDSAEATPEPVVEPTVDTMMETTVVPTVESTDEPTDESEAESEAESAAQSAAESPAGPKAETPAETAAETDVSVANAEVPDTESEDAHGLDVGELTQQAADEPFASGTDGAAPEEAWEGAGSAQGTTEAGGPAEAADVPKADERGLAALECAELESQPEPGDEPVPEPPADGDEGHRARAQEPVERIEWGGRRPGVLDWGPQDGHGHDETDEGECDASAADGAPSVPSESEEEFATALDLETAPEPEPVTASEPVVAPEPTASPEPAVAPEPAAALGTATEESTASHAEVAAPDVENGSVATEAASLPAPEEPVWDVEPFAAAESESQEPVPVGVRRALVAVRYLPARISVCRVLRQMGWEVEELADLDRAAERLLPRKFRAVFLDVSQPVPRSLQNALHREDLADIRWVGVGSRLRMVPDATPGRLRDAPRLFFPFGEDEARELVVSL